jgi:Transglycosylase-like domain
MRSHRRAGLTTGILLVALAASSLTLLPAAARDVRATPTQRDPVVDPHVVPAVVRADFVRYVTPPPHDVLSVAGLNDYLAFLESERQRVEAERVEAERVAAELARIEAARQAAEAEAARVAEAARQAAIRAAAPRPAPAPAPAPVYYTGGTNAHLYRIKMCESGGNYSVISSNGLYYGAYQFSLSTWAAMGGSGLPSNASPAEQDMRAQRLYDTSNPYTQWPVCAYR